MVEFGVDGLVEGGLTPVARDGDQMHWAARVFLAQTPDHFQSVHSRYADKLTQRPANTDSVKQSKFAATMTLVQANLADAQTKVGAFAQVSPTEWQGPYETANNALGRLEDSIQQAD